MNTTHFVFKIHTLGVRESAAVAVLACVPFTFEDDETFEGLMSKGLCVKFDIKEQLKEYKRTTDKETIDWWKKQANREAVLPSDEDWSLLDGLNTIKDFIEASNYDTKKSWIWARGLSFDLPKIEDLFRACNLELPFNSFMERDIRTMIDVLTGSTNGIFEIEQKNLKGYVKGDALCEAALDAYRMKKIYKTLDEQ